MNVLIAGSRSFTNKEFLYEKLIKSPLEVKNIEDITIISGGAIGADTLGEEFAKEHGLNIIQKLPDWKTHGKAAGFIRNKEMVDIADVVFCFWDGKSKGTKHTIDLTIDARKELHLYIKA